MTDEQLKKMIGDVVTELDREADNLALLGNMRSSVAMLGGKQMIRVLATRLFPDAVKATEGEPPPAEAPPIEVPPEAPPQEPPPASAFG